MRRKPSMVNPKIVELLEDLHSEIGDCFTMPENVYVVTKGIVGDNFVFDKAGFDDLTTDILESRLYASLESAKRNANPNSMIFSLEDFSKYAGIVLSLNVDKVDCNVVKDYNSEA